MEIVKIVAFAFIALFIVLILKKTKQELAIQVSIVAGIFIFLFLISKITMILQILQQLSLKANIDFIYLNTVFKILGISLVIFAVAFIREKSDKLD